MNRREALEMHNTKNTNDPQKKYRPGTISENILLEGLNCFLSPKRTLSSDVAEDT